MDLAAFRAAYPAQTFDHGGISWEYLRGGESDWTLLIFPGALGVAEASWSTIARYAEAGAKPRFDVVAFSYPGEIDSMSRLADGIGAVLDHLAIGAVRIFGASYGGLVAQEFARRRPDHIDRLLLSHTGAPDPARADRTRQGMRLWRRLPVPILKSMYRRQFSRTYREIGPPWDRQLTEHMEQIVSQRMSRESIVNTFLRVADFDEKWESEPGSAYSGPTLLLFGATDSATPPQERGRLRAIYPQAELTVFEDSGHATAITHADQYFARVNEFLA